MRPVDLNTGVSAYMLTLGVFIPVSGWVADRFGARKVFATAIALFTIASLLCGLAGTLSIFVLVRILQGIGGAMMVPVGRLRRAARDAERAADPGHCDADLAGAGRAGSRAAARRPDCRARRLALDLLSQPAARADRLCSGAVAGSGHEGRSRRSPSIGQASCLSGGALFCLLYVAELLGAAADRLGARRGLLQLSASVC